GGEYPRVSRAGLIERRLQCSRQRERSSETYAHTNEREQRAATYDKADDARRLRTERQSDRQLVPSLRDRVCERAVRTDGSQHYSQERERGNESGLEQRL